MTVLAGYNCIITGASRGLGAKIVAAFWEQGANLLVVARSKKTLAATVEVLSKRSNQFVETFEADLSDSMASEKIVQEARRRFGTLHVLVNNAGTQGPIGALWTNEWNEWQRTLQVNLLSPVALCRLCLPWMGEAGKGKIINLSGGGATGPRANFTAYATAKAGLVRFSETLAQEMQNSAIDVNCIAPGAMNTSMLSDVLKAGASAAGQKEYDLALNIGKTAGNSIERAAALCVFLASEASKGITGKLISAIWDPWERFSEHLSELQKTDIYTLRRIVPKDRGMDWGDR
jgi:3-oxoacyl-[acyl-carrier protein] reductase